MELFHLAQTATLPVLCKGLVWGPACAFFQWAGASAPLIGSLCESVTCQRRFCDKKVSAATVWNVRCVRLYKAEASLTTHLAAVEVWSRMS